MSCAISNIFYLKGKNAAWLKRSGWLLSRRMAFVRKQDLSQGTILYTLHSVRFVFETWLNQNKLGKLSFPSHSSFSNTPHRVRIFGEAVRGVRCFWNEIRSCRPMTMTVGIFKQLVQQCERGMRVLIALPRIRLYFLKP